MRRDPIEHQGPFNGAADDNGYGDGSGDGDGSGSKVLED